MKLVTWNINSVRLRLSLLARLIAQTNADIICLQEIKVAPELFPRDAITQLGYPHHYICGQKGYHGVAVLSRTPLLGEHCIRLLDSDQARHVAVTLPDGTELHNFYVPAGGDIPDRIQNPYFGFKLDYVDAMREWFTRERRSTAPMILVGDLNIAPLENDVWSHRQLLNIVSHTPQETERLNALQNALGWVDAARHFTPATEKLYTWWSYRNRDWRASNRGRRLDHIWLTKPLLPRLKSVATLVDARDWEQPSDHVPVVIELA